MPDILIRGMEMPKDGHVIVRVYANGDVCEPTPCPGVWEKVARAVPIPEGHGRLGDLDKLEKTLRMTAECQTGERQQGILGCCETIRMTKTIIPAEGGTDDV